MQRGEAKMKSLLLSVGLVALASGAQAQIFNNGVGFSVGQTNSPGNSSDTVSFTPGLHVLQGGALNLTISVVNDPSFATTGAQWAVFDYQATDSNLSVGTENWAINQVGIPLLVNANFIGDYTQWGSLNQTGSIFGQTLMSSPVPGLTGNGEGTLGFIDPIPAGPAPQLGAFANPFQIVINGLGGLTPNEFTQALEFEPSSFIPPTGVPELSTWAMMLLGFVGLGTAAFKRHKDRPAA
jgi:hypothetical protein